MARSTKRKPSTKESNLEYQRETFPGRIKVQRRKNVAVLKTSRSKPERAAATKSQRALDRLETRLGLTKPKGGIAGEAPNFRWRVGMAKRKALALKERWEKFSQEAKAKSATQKGKKPNRS